MGAYKFYNPSTEQWEIIKSKSIIKDDGSLEYTPDDIEAIDNKIGILNGVGEAQEKANKTDLTTLQTEITTHRADNVSQGEIHGLRVNKGKLEYYDGEWIIASGGIPVGNVSGLSIKEDDTEITLMWTDPEDRYLDGVKIAGWLGTKIIRKEGSYPVSDDDGTLVVDNTIKNQYATNGYTDTGLTNDVTYYYMAFPYTKDAITIDGANRISGIPRDTYDSSGSPGSPVTISGNMGEGFFGEVPASKFITGDALASECGISAGFSKSSTTEWLKFAHKGEILFVAKKTIRTSVHWDKINTAKCVYGDSGDKTVVIGGLTYKVTLMRGLEPSNDPKTIIVTDEGEIVHHSEWNRLIAQIHEQAINKNWGSPNNIESDIGILEHSLGSGSQGMYNSEDLNIEGYPDLGGYSWCQEMGQSTQHYVYRGGGPSGSSNDIDSYPYYGWRPVLRLIR